MAEDKQNLNAEQEQFEALYQKLFPQLYRYALSIFRNRSQLEMYIEGRAEEAVQEAFALAWEKREELFSNPSPAGWMFRATWLKAQELLRDEYVWVRRLLRLSQHQEREGQEDDFCLRLEMQSLLSEEEYTLLKKLYLDGYTYKELSRELGLGQSTLAMRVKRLKARISKELKA